MWLLFLLMHEWLSGSLFLPILLALRWGAPKWRALSWLTRSRRRWVLIWSCWGVIRVVGFAALYVALNYSDGEPWDMVLVAGAPAQAVWDLLSAHSASVPDIILILATICIGTILNAAIGGGFAALAWWLFQRWTEYTQAGRRTSVSVKCALSLLGSVWVLGLANNVEFRMANRCCDFVNSYGVPFTFFCEGGFFVIRYFVWRGVIGDAVVMILFAAALFSIWALLAGRKARTLA